MSSNKLATQPLKPLARAIVLETRGGTDKGEDGHRRDTIPICNSLIELGVSAEPVFYSDAEWRAVFSRAVDADIMVVRVNPGKYEGVTQSELERLVVGASNRGVLTMSHPEVMKRMGAKDALVKIRELQCGARDTYAYYGIAAFKEGFSKSIATGTRVLKQNRGSQGEGIWVCQVAPGQTGPVGPSTLLDLQEAVDNHKEQRTLEDFMNFCKQYLDGEDGQLIDQPFLPRIAEGEIRVNMIYDKPTEIVHKKPAPGGISATLASGATYTNYKPDDAAFAPLMERFLKHDLAHIMPALGLENQPLPLIWTADFILGPKDSQGNDTFVVGEFNCSCVGITQQLHLAPKVAKAALDILNRYRLGAVVAGLDTNKDGLVSESELKINLVIAADGSVALKIVLPDHVAAAVDLNGDGKVDQSEMKALQAAVEAYNAKPKAIAAVLSTQPSSPVGRVVVVEARGGGDKGPDGHRGDTIPICNALIKKGYQAEPVFYSDAEYAQLAIMLLKVDGVILRVNPGKHEGVSNRQLETLMVALADQGIAVMPHPEVMKTMGAKDALVKIKDLSCGANDTYAYSDMATFKQAFPKTLALGARVLKQNRGSQGEGVWVCKLAQGQSGPVTSSTLLDLQAAVDNHNEQRTLEDFMNSCKKYLEGEDGQLVDQPFLPRVAEGEVRVNMIYDKPTEIVHMKPAPGGISATLSSGATYTTYKPDDAAFAPLMARFLVRDLSNVMPALGMESQPLPLLWTADFILGPKTSGGQDTFFVSEFNCACVDITQQLHLADPVAAAAIKLMQLAKGSTRSVVQLPPLASRPDATPGLVGLPQVITKRNSVLQPLPSGQGGAGMLGSNSKNAAVKQYLDDLPPLGQRPVATAGLAGLPQVNTKVNSALEPLHGGYGGAGLLGSNSKSAEIKQYFEEARVMEVLRKGLKRLYRSQPQNPIRFLANFLAEHDPQAYGSPPVQRGVEF